MLKFYWLALPFILQMLFMAVDEFRFHRRRELPRWERIGHPLDALTVILCLAWILSKLPTPRAVTVYIGLAIFSCLFVTKDEPVHKRYCSAGELWIHAILFMLHPATLVSAGFLWPAIWNTPPGFERSFLLIVCAMMISFGIYLFVFWNLVWHPKKAAQ